MRTRRKSLKEAYLGQAYFAGGNQGASNQSLGQSSFGQSGNTPSGFDQPGPEPGPTPSGDADKDLSPYGLGGMNFRKRRKRLDDQEIMILVVQAMDRLVAL